MHVIRNPVDTYSSHVDLFGPTNPIRWCLMWNASVSLALRYSSEYSKDYVVVKYEELTQETEIVMSRLCNDLGITPEIENMVDLAGYSNVDNSSFKAQFGESKYVGNVRTSDNFDRSSKISANERLLVRELCGPLASVMGYDFQTCFEYNNLQDKDLRIGSPGIYLSKLVMKQLLGMMPKIAKKKVFGNPRTRGWYR